MESTQLSSFTKILEDIICILVYWKSNFKQKTSFGQINGKHFSGWSIECAFSSLIVIMLIISGNKWLDLCPL